MEVKIALRRKGEGSIDWKPFALEELESAVTRGESVHNACLRVSNRLKERFGIDPHAAHGDANRG